jgi:hypothetical protein
MTIVIGFLKKWVEICTKAGRKYVLSSAITISITVKTAETPEDARYERSLVARSEKKCGGIKASRRTTKIVNTRETLNLTERNLGSAGGVVTMIDGMPSIRVRKARMVWNSVSKRLTSERRGNGIEGTGSNMASFGTRMAVVR